MKIQIPQAAKKIKVNGHTMTKKVSWMRTWELLVLNLMTNTRIHLARNGSLVEAAEAVVEAEDLEAEQKEMVALEEATDQEEVRIPSAEHMQITFQIRKTFLMRAWYTRPEKSRSKTRRGTPAAHRCLGPTLALTQACRTGSKCGA